MRVVEIVTECEHGWVESHAWPGEVDAMHAGVWPMCPGGVRRVLEPGSFVLVEKVDGRWPYILSDHVHRILDALAEGEQ